MNSPTYTISLHCAGQHRGNPCPQQITTEYDRAPFHVWTDRLNNLARHLYWTTFTSGTGETEYYCPVCTRVRDAKDKA